jgi:predicted acylesterase/phospholipase RssA
MGGPRYETKNEAGVTYSLRSVRRLLVFTCFAALLAGCATQPRQIYSAAEQLAATPPGFLDIRMTTSDPKAVDELVSAIREMRARRGTPIEVLSLSGGGANGAYGAGVLYGWSERGDRPQFDIVTGVSTGALAAPFAFLGPDHDEILKRAYTGGYTQRLLDFQGFLALFRPGLYSGRPLSNLVETFIDESLVAAVAREHEKGRRLLVATSNLDTQDLALWNLGAIAATAAPNSVALFRQVLLASASVPGIFPPVMIDVVSRGRHFSEMHVDGSTNTSFVAVPESLLFSERSRAGSPTGNLYVLINGKLKSEFSITPLSTLPILERSYDTMSKVNTRIALQAVASFGKLSGVAVALSYIPESTPTSPLDFDKVRMTALFDLGRRQALAKKAWEPVGH